jgi:hypothetical protein
MSPGKHNSFICFVYSKARESETLDINNRRKPFIRRNGRLLLSYPLSFFVLITLPAGYNNDFLQLGASILAILIGLFLTALVFALDKFYIPPRKKDGDYRVETTENDQTRSIEISVEEIKYENAQEKLWQKQSLYYVQKFNVLVGKNVIVGIWALALICTYVMYYNFFSISLEDYSFVAITLPSILLFLKLLFIIVTRFFICYFLIEMFYNTVRIISSMVNFMSIRIQR